MTRELRSLEVMSYGECLDDAIVMCTGADTRLAAAADGGVLAFEVE